MKRTRARHPRPLRVAGPVFVSLFVFLEGGCASGSGPSASSGATAQEAAAKAGPTTPAPSSSPFKEKSETPSPHASTLEAYEKARASAWNPARRFKALFKAEVSPKAGAVGRGYLSVWWDGASGTLTWRSSAPIAGRGRGGFLRKEEEGAGPAVEGAGGGGAGRSPLPGNFSADDLIACILGTPDARASSSLQFEETPKGVRMRLDGSKRSVLLNRDGKPIEFSFPNDETVKLQPGEGVPRRIEASGPEGRAVLTLESYSSWPENERVPPA